MSTPTGKSALLIGATGATGSHLLRELLASPHFSRVGEYGRRLTPKAKFSSLPGAKEKLFQKTLDFEKLFDENSAEVQDLRDGKWDVVLFSFGISRAEAGSDEAFERIDRLYPVQVAKAVKTADPNHDQRIVYIATLSANANAQSLYSRSKGLTENALASLGYADTITFRPGFIANANRPETPLIEKVAAWATWFVSPFSSSTAGKMSIDIRQLARSLRKAGELGSKDLPSEAEAKTQRAGSEPDAPEFTVIANAGAIAFSKVKDS